MLENFRQAPKLLYNGDKGYKREEQHYNIPQQLADIINNKLGNASAQLRLMYVLVGTAEYFAISEKWICERTGLTKDSYHKARKELIKKGWLSHNPKEHSLTIEFDYIYQCGKGMNESYAKSMNENYSMSMNDYSSRVCTNITITDKTNKTNKSIDKTVSPPCGGSLQSREQLKNEKKLLSFADALKDEEESNNIYDDEEKRKTKRLENELEQLRISRLISEGKY